MADQTATTRDKEITKGTITPEQRAELVNNAIQKKILELSLRYGGGAKG